MALWGRTFGEMFATHSVCDGTILAVNLFSKTEPCIRHAAVAISSCHAALVRTNGAPTAAENEFTLTQYNKALRELNSVKHAPDVRVVLTLCSMLVVLEILLGRDDKWRLHLKNGTSIACRVKEEHGLEWKKIQSLYVSFERLYCHSSSFPGFGEAALCPQDQPQIFTKLGPPSIRSLPEAVANFMAIMKACLPFFQASNPGASYDYGRSRDQLIFHLEEWRDTFQLFKASKSSLFSQEEVLRAAMLDVNAEMLWIRLSAALASDELIWDQFDDRFRGLIQSLEEIVAGVKIKPWTLDWAGEVCETQPLFYIATKCRDRGVRWDALKLLFQCRGRHGCWDGGPLVLTAKRVVELEERGRVVWTSRDVPAEARFFSVLMEPNPADRRVVIKCFRAKTSGIEEIEEVLTW
ncbi:MAG: hypothetical protein MMC23_001570 [Stictis urceolatum]|nr:hypothetical protein [Stictis urceolata]